MDVHGVSGENFFKMTLPGRRESETPQLSAWKLLCSVSKRGEIHSVETITWNYPNRTPPPEKSAHRDPRRFLQPLQRTASDVRREEGGGREGERQEGGRRGVGGGGIPH